jgi:hypothetical protein
VRSSLVTLVLLAGLSFAIISPRATAAEGRLGPATLTVPKTRIACFHRQVNRFTPEREPHNCDVAGHEFGGREFVSFQLNGILWEKWGRFRSLASLNSAFRQRHVVYRVVAFRRVECSDGQVWYSRANVVGARGDIHFLRLPVCGQTTV